MHPIHRVSRGTRPPSWPPGPAAGAVVHDLDGNDLADALAALAEAGAPVPAFLLASGDGGTLRLVTDLDPERLDRALPGGALRGLAVSWTSASCTRYLVARPVEARRTTSTRSATSTTCTTRWPPPRARAAPPCCSTPTPVQGVVDVAAGGERMPRKSTLFTPKPRTGLVIRDHRDA